MGETRDLMGKKAVKSKVEKEDGRANRVVSLTTYGAQVIRLEMQPKW